MSAYIIVQEGDRRFVIGRRKIGRDAEFIGLCVSTSESNAREIADALNEYKRTSAEREVAANRAAAESLIKNRRKAS
jgi:hypothetical protein